MALCLLKVNPPVIAHRGASAYAPENTMAAFKQAQGCGANWVEFDVMLAACGEVVVIHDETLERTTNGKGLVCDVPYSYLQTLDAGSWFGSQFVGERIPTLSQVLLFLGQNAMSANIEIKAVAGKERETVQRVLAIVQAVRFSQVLISSFSLEILQEVRRQSASVAVGLLMENLFAGWEQMSADLRCDTLNVNHEIIDLECLQILQKQAKPLFCYTVNDAVRAEELFAMGIAAVFTDRPDML